MQFVETEMGLSVDANFVDRVGGFVPMQMVVKGILYGKPFLHSYNSALWHFFVWFLSDVEQEEQGMKRNKSSSTKRNKSSKTLINSDNNHNNQI